jgi:UDP-glucose 4-epimerase
MAGGAVLVTGARGYLGGRLIQHLAAQGREVVGSSRGSAPTPPGWPDEVRSVVLNPTDEPATLRPLLEGVKAVVHLSAANEHRSAAEPDAAVWETGVGARRLLEAAVAAGVRRFVYLSTIHVYGAPLKGRLTEEAFTRPAHPYAITHRLAEDFVLAAHDTGRIEAAVVRLSNGTGAPAWTAVDRWTLVGNDLARQAVERGEMVLKAPGQWRDFIPLQDVCAGIAALLGAPREALGDGVFNLGGGGARTVAEVARLTAEAAEMRLGRPVTVRSEGPPPDGSPPPFDFVIDKIRALGFEPSGEAGLRAELAATVALLADAQAAQ